MNRGYRERWGNLTVTVDKVGESPDGNTLVEVTVHDSPVTEEMSVRLWVSNEYYGSMIPWLATRIVLLDLASSEYERVRRVEAGRLVPEVRLENKADYLEAFESVPGLSRLALKLPEEALKAHNVFLMESRMAYDNDVSAAASEHNAHKLIFSRGLPDAVEFVVDESGARVVVARWNGRNPREHRFHGFDWKTVAGQYALDDFLGMLNVKAPLQPEDIKPRRIPKRRGPKEWAPDEMQSFILIKGRDYGRPAE